MNPYPRSSYQPPAMAATIGSTYPVPSSSTPGVVYLVRVDPATLLYTCTCPDHRHRSRDCKHIRSVQVGGIPPRGCGLAARPKGTETPARWFDYRGGRSAGCTPHAPPPSYRTPSTADLDDLYTDAGATLDRALASRAVRS